jgi:hypothetical protein
MLKQLLCSTALLCVAGLANAGVVTQHFTIEHTNTNFTKQIDYKLFDTLNGSRELESVEITLLAEVTATAEAENRSTSSEDTVTATVSAVIALIDLAGDTILQVAPNNSLTKTLGTWDGTFDFGGTSGATFFGLDASETQSKFYTDAATLLSFIGIGTSTSTIVFDASALSRVTGGGNMISGITTVSGGSVDVVYTYSDAVNVSAPAQIMLFSFGLLALVGLRKRLR